MTNFSALGSQLRSHRSESREGVSLAADAAAINHEFPTRLLQLAVVGLLLVTLSGCQGVSANPKPSNGGSIAGQLDVSPASINFGNVPVGTTKKIAATVSNTGGVALTISQAAASGSGFAFSGMTLPTTLAAGQSATVSLIFSPEATGAASGSLSITSDASNPAVTLPLAGTGVASGMLTANPPSLTFGNVLIGSTQSLAVNVSNAGTSGINISEVSASGTGFAVSGLTAPASLAAGQSATLNVTFSPQATGAVTGSVAIVGDTASVNIALAGAGVTAGTLVANPGSVSMGSVQIGDTQSQTFQLTNSGGSAVIISQAAMTGSGLTFTGLTVPSTLGAGASETITVTFAPQASGAVNGNLAIVSDASNSTLNVAISATGLAAGSLTASPSSLNFGNVQVGNKQTLSESLTNSSTSSITVSQASATGSGFSFSGLTVPRTIAAGQSATFNVSFAPTKNGNSSGSISIISDAPNPNLSIPLSGNGFTPSQLSVSPTSMNLGSVVVGQSHSSSGTLSASGGNVTVSSGSSNSAEFALSGISFPVTINAGQNASFTVTFTPQSSGSASGAITFVSNATNSPTVESVSGTGTAPPQHSVDLTWTASTSVVAGYNVYRGANHGGPYSKINSSLDPNTAYTDSAVQAGATYYYVATAVNSSGGESTYSNEVQAVIPTP